MKKRSFLIIGIILMIVIIVGITNTGFLTLNQNNQEDIKIGFVGPLTGDISIYGLSAKEGVDIAVEEINKKGGINGKKINIIYEDDVCDKAKTINILNKFIFFDKINFVVGPICSGSVLATAQLAENNNILLFSPVATHPDISFAGDYIFRNTVSDDFIGDFLARYIYNDLNKKRAAVIYVNQDYGVGLYNKFKSTFDQIGGVITISESYDLEKTKDFKSIILKMKNSNPNVFVILSYSSEGGLIVKQIKELGINDLIIGGDAFGTNEVLKSGGVSLEGALSVIPFLDENNLNTIKFIESYKQKHNKEPDLLWASANAYDIIMLLKEGIEKYGYDSTKVKEYLYSVKDYPGVGGKTTFDEYGDVIKSVKVQIVKNDEFIEYLP